MRCNLRKLYLDTHCLSLLKASGFPSTSGCCFRRLGFKTCLALVDSRLALLIHTGQIIWIPKWAQNLHFISNFFYIYLIICLCVCPCVPPWCGSLRTVCRSWFFPSNMWDPWIKSRLSGWFKCLYRWANSVTQEPTLKKKKNLPGELILTDVWEQTFWMVGAMRKCFLWCAQGSGRLWNQAEMAEEKDRQTTS